MINPIRFILLLGLFILCSCSKFVQFNKELGLQVKHDFLQKIEQSDTVNNTINFTELTTFDWDSLWIGQLSASNINELKNEEDRERILATPVVQGGVFLIGFIKDDKMLTYFEVSQRELIDIAVIETFIPKSEATFEIEKTPYFTEMTFLGWKTWKKQEIEKQSEAAKKELFFAAQDLYNPFDTLKYNRVVAYSFNVGKYTPEPTSIVIDKKTGKLNSTLSYPWKEITGHLADKLIYTLTDTATYGNSKSACFQPRLGVVFYNDKKIVASVDICFECNYLSSDPFIPATYYYNEDISTDEDFLVMMKNGFSERGFSQLVSLCQEIGLPYCKN